jgi:RNA polymerase sigma-70 factor, ECF subfamily
MSATGFGLPPALGREQPVHAARAVVGLMPSADAEMRDAVGQHLHLVWRVLRRAGLSPVDAEDASQDVFWILAQRLDAVPERAHKAFLVSTALRVAADRRRSKWHRSVDVGLELDEHECPTPAADHQLEVRRAAQLLDRALATLDEGDRDVYILAELEQLSRSEVAETLRLPKGTVASRLRRAREAFEVALRRLHRGGRP